MVIFNSFQGGERNGSGTTHFSAVNAQCFVNILWESLHYWVVKLLRKLSLLALSLAVIDGFSTVIDCVAVVSTGDNTKPIADNTSKQHDIPH